MSISYETSSKATLINYSSFLGKMYVYNHVNLDLLKTLKTEFSEVWNSGFNKETSTRAIARSTELGLKFPSLVSGILQRFSVVERTASKSSNFYLEIVLLEDNDEKIIFSLPLANKATQLLARKLVNAELGITTSIKLFCVFDDVTGFANHGCICKQDSVEVLGIDPKIDLLPELEKIKSNFQASGIDDKKTINQALLSARVNWHKKLVDKAVANQFDHVDHVPSSSEDDTY